MRGCPFTVLPERVHFAGIGPSRALRKASGPQRILLRGLPRASDDGLAQPCFAQEAGLSARSIAERPRFAGMCSAAGQGVVMALLAGLSDGPAPEQSGPEDGRPPSPRQRRPQPGASNAFNR